MSNVLNGATGAKLGSYLITSAFPAVGILYIINDFLSGHVRLRGRGGGAYPYKYLEMIDELYGPESASNTIEVCSGTVQDTNCFTVDINPDTNPTLVDDGQVFSRVGDNTFSRWRCDPPYNNKDSFPHVRYRATQFRKATKSRS
jgi:hypothetical protein